MPNRPSKDHWTDVSLGRTDFSLSLVNNFRDRWSCVSLSMTGTHAKASFALVKAGHSGDVESRLAPLGELLWQPKPDAKESAVTVLRKVAPADPATWPDLNAWMAGTMRTMHDLFRPIVKILDASEYVPAPEETLGGPEATSGGIDPQ